MSVSPSEIIARARSLIALPTFSEAATFPDGFIAPSGFATALINVPKGSMVEIPNYSLPVIPAPTAIDANPQEAVYRAIDCVLTMPIIPTAVAPVWGTPTIPVSTKYGKITAAPVDYPQQELEILPTDAGLTPNMVLTPITVGIRPVPEALIVNKFVPELLLPFDDDLPEYKDLGTFISLSPAEVFYTADQNLLNHILGTMAGNTSLSEVAQTAMFDSKLEWADVEERLAEQKAFEAAAAKGFSLPSPGLIDAILETTSKDTKEREKANREIVDEVIKRGRETQLAALDVSTALEKAHASLFNNYVGRILKTQRFNVKMAVTLYDAVVKLYNAKVSLVAILIRSYKEYTQTVRTQNSAIEAQGQGEAARLEALQSETVSYEAQIGTAKAMAQIERLRTELATLPITEFEAKIVGVMANVNIVKKNIQAYETAVKAFSQATEVVNERWDTYIAEVGAAISVVSVDSANAKENISYSQTETGRMQAYASYVGRAVQHLDGEIGEYSAYSQAQRGYLQALTGKITAEAQSVEAFARAVGSITSYTTGWNRAEAERTGAVNMFDLVHAEQDTRQQALNTEAQAAQARIRSGWLSARAQAAAGQAQAAYGITTAQLHLSAGISSQNESTDAASTTFHESAERQYSAHRSIAANASRSA